MNNSIKNAFFSVIKNPFLENLIISLIKVIPDKYEGTIKKAVPQPYNYTSEEYRLVTRFNCKWKLFLREYFQWNQYYTFKDPNIDLLLKHSNNSNLVLDIGANIGFLSVLMAKNIKESGRVISFEPHPYTYQRLVMHKDMNQLENLFPENIALSNEDGEAELFDWSGGDSGKFSLRQNKEAKGKVKTTIKKLDTYCIENNIEKVDLIKIDVEGFEPEMLDGGREIISKSLPIIFIEFSPQWYQTKKEVTNSVIEWLYSIEYKFRNIETGDEVDLRKAINHSTQINALGSVLNNL